MFPKRVPPPSSRSKSKLNKTRKKVVDKQQRLILFSVYSSTMKMEAIHSYETSLNLYQPTRSYNPEDRILYEPKIRNREFLFLPTDRKETNS